MTRSEALELLEEWVANPNLRKHMRAVEEAMCFYARKFGGDSELWGLAGLLHDADWERWPAEHPKRIIAELERRGVDPSVPRAIASHGNNFGIPRETPMEKALFAVDEITGFIVACALLRPGKLTDLSTESVTSKMRDKSFARNVNREELLQGAEELGLPFKEHVGNVISVMQGIQDELGLRGSRP